MLDFLGDLTGSLQITRLRVRLVLATGDAAKTGILLGQTAALCGILVPFLENTFDLRDIHVRADPDFEKRQNGMGGGGVLRHPPDHLHQDRIPAQKAAPAAV